MNLKKCNYVFADPVTYIPEKLIGWKSLPENIVNVTSTELNKN